MAVHSFSRIAGRWAILRFPADSEIPRWAQTARGFVTISRTAEELSIIAPRGSVPAHTLVEVEWALFRVTGPFPFEVVGVLNAFTGPLAAAGVPVMAVATHDTDYLLVRAEDEQRALTALTHAGHRLVP